MPEYYQNLEAAHEALKVITDSDYINGVVPEQQEDLQVLCFLFGKYLESFQTERDTILERLVNMFRNEKVKSGYRPIDIVRNNDVKLSYKSGDGMANIDVTYLCRKESGERVIIADKKKKFATALFDIFAEMANDSKSSIAERAAVIATSKKDNTNFAIRMMNKFKDNEQLAKLGDELRTKAPNLMSTGENGAPDFQKTFEYVSNNPEILRTASSFMKDSNLINDITEDLPLDGMS